MKDSNDSLKRGFDDFSERYWKCWNSAAEARGTSRMLAKADRDTAIEMLSMLFIRMGGSSMDALRMVCLCCAPASAETVNARGTGVLTFLPA